MGTPFQRRKMLVRPRLQTRLILAFLGVSTFALLLQFVLFACALSVMAAQLPQDGQILLEEATSAALAILAVSLWVLLPLAFAVGLVLTFRVAGPLYRFEQHLLKIAEGADPGPCRIRQGDELQDFCATLNTALERLRRDGAWSRTGPTSTSTAAASVASGREAA